MEPRLADQLAAHGHDIRLTRPALVDPEVGTAFLAVWCTLGAWQRRQDLHGAARCEEAMSRLFGVLVPRYSTHRRAIPTPALGPELERVRDRLAHQIETPPSLADLAAEADVSRFALIRRFERVRRSAAAARGR